MERRAFCFVKFSSNLHRSHTPSSLNRPLFTSAYPTPGRRTLRGRVAGQYPIQERVRGGNGRDRVVLGGRPCVFGGGTGQVAALCDGEEEVATWGVRQPIALILDRAGHPRERRRRPGEADGAHVLQPAGASCVQYEGAAPGAAGLGARDRCVRFPLRKPRRQETKGDERR